MFVSIRLVPPYPDEPTISNPAHGLPLALDRLFVGRREASAQGVTRRCAQARRAQPMGIWIIALAIWLDMFIYTVKAAKFATAPCVAGVEDGRMIWQQSLPTLVYRNSKRRNGEKP